MPASQISQGKAILDLRKEKLRPRTQDQIRAKIQVSQILNLLQDHVLNGTEVAHTRITAGLALIKKVLPDAIHESIEQNNQAQALQAISQAQLTLMAQEMVRQQQGVTLDQSNNESVLKIESNTTTLDSVPESIPLEIPTFVVNKQQDGDG